MQRVPGARGQPHRGGRPVQADGHGRGPAQPERRGLALERNMPGTKPVYIYNAEVLNVVDGDTVDLRVDLGFHITLELRFRLARINTAELHDPRVEIKNLAIRAKDRLTALLKDPGVTIRSNKPYSEDKYGRWLADIYLKDGTCANDTLLTE